MENLRPTSTAGHGSKDQNESVQDLRQTTTKFIQRQARDGLRDLEYCWFLTKTKNKEISDQILPEPLRSNDYL